eukprot:scaffold6568_cov126-Isochrysis_galbana.AAC.5
MDSVSQGERGGDASLPEDSNSRVSCRIRPLAHLILKKKFFDCGCMTNCWEAFTQISQISASICIGIEHRARAAVTEQ